MQAGPSQPMETTYQAASRSVYRDAKGGARVVSQLSSLPAIHGGGRENLGENQVYLPDIVGKDRNKFFGRPLVPYMQAMEAPPDVLLAKPDQFGVGPSRVGGTGAGAAAASSSSSTAAAERLHRWRAGGDGEVGDGGRTRTTGTQSDYRESEAQTDPFTPDYIVPEGHNPEVLMLAHLTYANGGLPAGKEEIEMIDRLRRRRDVEASLPPITDDASLQKRLELLTKLEVTEWGEREAQIQQVQDERLKLIETALHKREAEREDTDRQKVVNVKNRQLQQCTQKINQLREKRIREFRRLEKKRPNMENRSQKRNIIADYANFSSEAYAPKTRSGLCTDKMPMPEPQPFLLETYDGVHVLDQVTSRTQNLGPKRTFAPRPSVIKETQTLKTAAQIELAQKKLDMSKVAQEDEDGHVLDLYRKTPRVVRPPTPTLTVDEDMEERVQAAVLLQRLLRGRASQNMMFEGKERSLELITELRATENVKEKEREMSDQMAVEARQRQQKQLVDTLVEMVQGDIVGRSLHFLSKELHRQREVHRISHFARVARQTRTRREAEESGRRQMEEELRSREDRQFQQTVSTVDEAIDSFLDDVMSDAVDDCAHRQAVEEEETKVSVLDAAISQLEAQMDMPENIIRDVVSAFLLPEVQRELERDEIRQVEDTSVHAAHTEILASMLAVQESQEQE